jgi:hypothetical protein
MEVVSPALRFNCDSDGIEAVSLQLGQAVEFPHIAGVTSIL